MRKEDHAVQKNNTERRMVQTRQMERNSSESVENTTSFSHVKRAKCKISEAQGSKGCRKLGRLGGRQGVEASPTSSLLPPGG